MSNPSTTKFIQFIDDKKVTQIVNVEQIVNIESYKNGKYLIINTTRGESLEVRDPSLQLLSKLNIDVCTDAPS